MCRQAAQQEPLYPEAAQGCHASQLMLLLDSLLASLSRADCGCTGVNSHLT